MSDAAARARPPGLLGSLLFVNEHAQEQLAGETGAGDPAVLGSGWSRWSRSPTVRGISVAGEHNGSVLSGLLARGDEDIDAREASGVLVARPPRG